MRGSRCRRRAAVAQGLDDLPWPGAELRRQGAWPGSRINADGWQSPIAKFLSTTSKRARSARARRARRRDLLFSVADEARGRSNGSRRAAAAARRQARHDPERSRWSFLWVDRLPAPRVSSARRSARWRLHTIRSPRRGTRTCDRSRATPTRVRAQAYDVVLNGNELGGGIDPYPSARRTGARLRRARHDRASERASQFGFLLDALALRRAAARRHRPRARPAGDAARWSNHRSAT